METSDFYHYVPGNPMNIIPPTPGWRVCFFALKGALNG